MSDLRTYFSRAIVLTLKRTPQRLAAFQERLAACQWPFCEVTVQYGIDGRLCPPPPWFHAGNAAWGCKESHEKAIRDALNDNVARLLVMEDDFEPVPDFAAKVVAFIAALPGDAELVYYGGQLTHLNLEEHPPEKINALVLRPFSVNRMHAYSLTASGLRKVYRHFNRWNWNQGTQGPKGGWKGVSHCDHHLEVLSRNRQIATYAPTEWLVNQAASYSEIMGRHLPSRPFNKQGEPPKVIAVLGPYCGGTSAVAGALHHLGILMGHKFIHGATPHTPKGCFEAQALFDVCQACFPEPTFSGGCDSKGRVTLLHRWAMGRWGDGAVIGAKHPKLCLMVPEMLEAWPGCRFVVVNRPIDKSIASLDKLGWWKAGIAPADLIHRLVETRDQCLSVVDSERRCTIDYDAFLQFPAQHLDILAKWAGIEPTPEQFAKAAAQVDKSLNHH